MFKLIRSLLPLLLAASLFTLAPPKEASAEPGIGGFDVLLGLGAQICHAGQCQEDVFEVGPIGSISVGYVFDLGKIIGAGIFADLDMGGMIHDNYKSSLTVQANGMLKFFIRAVVMDVWLGVGGGYSYYTATYDNALDTSWSWQGPTIKASAGLTFFLPVLPSLGIGLDYSYIHSFEGSASGTLGPITFNSDKKTELFDLSQLKAHVRLNF